MKNTLTVKLKNGDVDFYNDALFSWLYEQEILSITDLKEEVRLAVYNSNYVISIKNQVWE